MRSLMRPLLWGHGRLRDLGDVRAGCGAVAVADDCLGLHRLGHDPVVQVGRVDEGQRAAGGVEGGGGPAEQEARLGLGAQAERLVEEVPAIGGRIVVADHRGSGVLQGERLVAAAVLVVVLGIGPSGDIGGVRHRPGVAGASSPGLRGDGVVDTDTRLTGPGREVAHRAQDVGDQVGVLGRVRDGPGLVVVVARRAVVTEVERQPPASWVSSA